MPSRPWLHTANWPLHSSTSDEAEPARASSHPLGCRSMPPNCRAVASCHTHTLSGRGPTWSGRQPTSDQSKERPRLPLGRLERLPRRVGQTAALTHSSRRFGARATSFGATDYQAINGAQRHQQAPVWSLPDELPTPLADKRSLAAPILHRADQGAPDLPPTSVFTLES